ncbi:MAG: hypothetical protein WAT19_02010 [Ferruginibacter sp.]
MKKQLLLLLLAVATGIFSYGQCDKKIMLYGSSFEMLNAADEVQREDERSVSIVYDSKLILFTPGDNTMKGTVNSITCNWVTPFKEGKTVIKATISREDGTTLNATMTIEGKNGKNILIAEFEGSDYPKMRLSLEKFEETK